MKLLLDMSQSLVNEGRFPLHVKDKVRIIEFSFRSQSLVNEGRFPQYRDYKRRYKKFLRSQSLVNEGRFPHRDRF